MKTFVSSSNTGASDPVTDIPNTRRHQQQALLLLLPARSGQATLLPADTAECNWAILSNSEDQGSGAPQQGDNQCVDGATHTHPLKKLLLRGQRVS